MLVRAGKHPQLTGSADEVVNIWWQRVRLAGGHTRLPVRRGDRELAVMPQYELVELDKFGSRIDAAVDQPLPHLLEDLKGISLAA
jgi:hypothetical protein